MPSTRGDVRLILWEGDGLAIDYWPTRACNAVLPLSRTVCRGVYLYGSCRSLLVTATIPPLSPTISACFHMLSSDGPVISLPGIDLTATYTLREPQTAFSRSTAEHQHVGTYDLGGLDFGTTFAELQVGAPVHNDFLACLEHDYNQYGSFLCNATMPFNVLAANILRIALNTPRGTSTYWTVSLSPNLHAAILQPPTPSILSFLRTHLTRHYCLARLARLWPLAAM